MIASENKNQSGQAASIPGVSRFTEFDIYLFREGKHYSLYNKLGAHIMEHEGVMGTYFAVWAPNAEKVSVIGDFNGWNRESHPMYVRFDSSGVWEAFIPGLGHGTVYKYFIASRVDGYSAEKGDPYGLLWEIPPRTASIVWDITHKWTDKLWLEKRLKLKGQPQPYSVYELHMGSWKRVPEEDNRSFTYRELAQELPAYVKELGFTHIEFMPVMEHPFFGSWGYQITGYFAPSSRYGSPQDFMLLINALHEEGIGVILDWVPSHFPSDLHGLAYFDGTHLYEHADMRKGYHPDWKSYIFNYSRNEVRSFLISNALFWLDVYHIDGLRVDAVASMLYLDYSRKEGEWIPNEYGGRENLEAISFLKEFNTAVYGNFPDVQTIAEESTAWPMVSRPTYIGGLGFGMKWMMGWMHDTLEYFAKEPVYRKFHQNMLTFSLYYAFTENFMLPLSHDEVVYGKKPLVYKMPGDHWQQFANLRLLYGYMFAHPGTKLIFMGGEFGQTTEWAHEKSLDWHLMQYAPHQGMKSLMSALNTIYKEEGALYEYNFEESGFEWIDINDSENSVICWLRKGKAEKDQIVVIANFTPVPRENYRVGVPKKGFYAQILNTDAEIFGGSGIGNLPVAESLPAPAHGRENSIAVNLPPLGIMYFKYQKKAGS
ncbi:1,4-alpha-glucan branching protein GlgB [Rhodocytophaga rosea]|uniref:1,4-alpha-glucan branching enzyme GlgB n=1 Tax=Rhodocytophaga rosea TaxID=2704465 RepID=A0A6C0GLR0_9BACT|nr:1,4-alpha-glucan branching protein GlgB [Rhodocytophaga rosea]QHT68877.1 1,4-alpha-glucan branching protein GlgB [Rhodocytophaga rosea]